MVNKHSLTYFLLSSESLIDLTHCQIETFHNIIPMRLAKFFWIRTKSNLFLFKDFHYEKQITFNNIIINNLLELICKYFRNGIYFIEEILFQTYINTTYCIKYFFYSKRKKTNRAEQFGALYLLTKLSRVDIGMLFIFQFWQIFAFIVYDNSSRIIYH